MKPFRSAFTLLEMMIAIVIFSLITISLYQSVNTLRQSNRAHAQYLEKTSDHAMILKHIFLDLSLDVNTTRIINEERNYDSVLMQTTHSVHRHIMPYVGYIVRDRMLYRLESFNRIEPPIEPMQFMQVDPLAEVETFRVYTNKTHYLLHLKFPGEPEQLMKVPALN